MANNKHIKELQDIKLRIKLYNPDYNEKQIDKAYQFVESEYAKMTKQLSRDTLTHMLQTLRTLIDFEVDDITIIASLVHQLPKHCNVHPRKIGEMFGDEVQMIVENLLKLNRIVFKEQSEEKYESIRKMTLVVAADFRVILIKVSHRTHTLKFIEQYPKEEQIRIAKETLHIYCPIINILGVWQLLSILEDASFKFLEPQMYSKIEKRYTRDKIARKKFIESIVENVDKALKKDKIQARIDGRMKHIYSIYKKMERKNKNINEIYDVYAFRIVTNSINECYSVLGLIHKIWIPKSGRFKDYIAIPKSNGYRSLHTTVYGPDDKLVEFQIRTSEMDKDAEFGVAAHFFYKNTKDAKKGNIWSKEVVKLQELYKNRSYSSRDMQLDVFRDSIFVFSANGEVIDVPLGSTCLDYAYIKNEDLANQSLYAIVNGKTQELSYLLHSGDSVEIISHKAAKPVPYWLKIAHNSETKRKVQNWLCSRQNKIKVVEGEEILNIQLDRFLGYSVKHLSQTQIVKVLEFAGVNNISELFPEIYTGKVHVSDILKYIFSERKLLKSQSLLPIEFNKNKKIKLVVHTSRGNENDIPKMVDILREHSCKLYEVSTTPDSAMNKFSTYNFTIEALEFETVYHVCNAIYNMQNVTSVKKR